MLANLVGLAGAVPDGWISLATGDPYLAGAMPFEGTAEKAERVRTAIAEHSLPIDAAVMPRVRFARKRLLISDMDSTIIGQECIDELADAVGLKPQISEITERAMRGELDFEAALTSRVAMLRGLSLNELDRTLRERITLNPGARTLIATMKAHGAATLLVSGGFTFFTSRVARMAGFDADLGNTLRDDGVALTGEVGRPILGREAKREALIEAVTQLGASPEDAIAMGDGANDLDMIRAAGIGVAYKAKPLVAAEANASIQHTDLTAALFFQGYRASDVVKG
jgi:phosphoserine phosphatase